MTTRLFLMDGVSQKDIDSLLGYLRHVCGSGAWLEDYRGERFIDLAENEWVRPVRARYGHIISDMVII